jgi:hypothetical protein
VQVRRGETLGFTDQTLGDDFRVCH